MLISAPFVPMNTRPDFVPVRGCCLYDPGPRTSRIGTLKTEVLSLFEVPPDGGVHRSACRGARHTARRLRDDDPASSSEAYTHAFPCLKHIVRESSVAGMVLAIRVGVVVIGISYGGGPRPVPSRSDWRSANNVTPSSNGSPQQAAQTALFLCEVFRRRGDDIEHALR